MHQSVTSPKVQSKAWSAACAAMILAPRHQWWTYRMEAAIVLYAIAAAPNQKNQGTRSSAMIRPRRTLNNVELRMHARRERSNQTLVGIRRGAEL
jgi:hypothetical protein